MEKKLTITESEGSISFHTEGFTRFELLGILRFYEKNIFMRIYNNQEEGLKDEKQSEETKKND